MAKKSCWTQGQNFQSSYRQSAIFSFLFEALWHHYIFLCQNTWLKTKWANGILYRSLEHFQRLSCTNNSGTNVKRPTLPCVSEIFAWWDPFLKYRLTWWQGSCKVMAIAKVFVFIQRISISQCHELLKYLMHHVQNWLVRILPTIKPYFDFDTSSWAHSWKQMWNIAT